MIVEADGSEDEAATGQALLREALSARRGRGVDAVAARGGVGALALARRHGHRRRRHLGGKVSEDVAVPVEQLGEVIAVTHEAAADGRQACCAGVTPATAMHSSFLFDGGDAAAGLQAAAAAERVFDAAISLGGTVTGEHGVGLVKSAQLAAALARSPRDPPRGQAAVRPKGPAQPRGKKVA